MNFTLKYKQIIEWLLEGDISIQFQTQRDLLGNHKPNLQKRIENEGWGKAFLSKRNTHGHWGKRYYEPKWISSHYTLLDLKNLNINPKQKDIQECLQLTVTQNKAPDGGINPIGTVQRSDVCINGMFLNFASYFKVKEQHLKSVVDFILNQKMKDGGFNCRSNRRKPIHSSVHTTISILEGITEYEQNGYTYRLDELKEVQSTSIEFLLLHQLYLSDRTGGIIHPQFIRLSYPSRWKYDILRALDYFQHANVQWDDRMTKAIDIIKQKRTKHGFWKLQSKHPGKTHLDMEKGGKPSRWNTLRALRVFKHYQIDQNH